MMENALTIVTPAMIKCFLSCCLDIAYKTNDSYISNERRLYRDILKDYEKTVRPVRNESETVRVRLGLALTGIENLASLLFLRIFSAMYITFNES